jgi:hypothetical protein
MNLDLTGVRAKLARSQEHAQTLKNEIRTWMDRSPYSVTTQANADSTRYSIFLRVNEEPQLQRWTLIFADALHNLRSSLDYLVYAIAVYESSSNPPPYERRLQFPIEDNGPDFDESVRTRRLGDISDPVRTIFKSVQPYNRPHPELPPLLAILRKLTNSDKHRLLRLAFAAIAKGNIGFKSTTSQDDRNWRAFPHSGEVKDGTEIFAMACDRPSPDMEYERTEFEIVVTVGHDKRDPSGPEGSDRTELVALFMALHTEVRKVIYMFAKL